MTAIAYGYVRPVGLSFEQALEKIEAALKTEGFGVLFQLDMQAKLREKLGVEFGRYVILGACNPPLAHQALQQEIDLGLLLPCNAVVYEREGRVHVGAIDAEKLLSLVGDSGMAPMAREVNLAMRRAVDSVAAA